MPTRLTLILLSALLAFSAPRAGAQDDDITVTADVAARRVYVGDRVTYQLRVEGSNAPGTPELDLPRGVTARYVSGHEQSRSFTTIINGRRQTRGSLAYVITYELVIHETGTLTLGPATVEIEGQRYASNRVQLDALRPETVEGFVIQADLERDTLYVGEVARVRVSWYIGGDATAPSFDATNIPPGFEVLPSRVPPAQGELFRFDMFGQPVVGVLDDAVLDGQRYRRLRFDLLVSPTREGEFDLGPITVVFDRVSRGVGRVRSAVESDPIAVAVRTPPVDGQPAGYTGLIGRFSIDSAIPVDTVNVGDPIELTVQVRGDEPMPGVTDGPRLPAQPEFADNFRLSTDGWERIETTQTGSRLFRTTIRALSADVTRVPPVRLPYFDVELGEYLVAESDAIPITVRAVREITAADAVLGPTAPRVARSPLEDAGASVWAPDPPESILRADGFDVVAALKRPVWVAVVCAPPIAFAMIALAVFARGRVSPERRRRRGALKAAERELRASGPGRAARRLVGDLLGRDPASVTAADCASFDLDERAAGDLRQVIQSEEATRFGAAPPSATGQQQARALLRLVYKTAEVRA